MHQNIYFDYSATDIKYEKFTKFKYKGKLIIFSNI